MITNRKIRFNYNIISSYEAGMQLFGTEVKVLRKGMGTIDNAYAMLEGGEVFLQQMNIPKYKYSRANHEELRPRKLLLKRKEINKLLRSTQEHYTIIPSKVYFNKRGYVKVTIALCTGKKQYDRRRDIKERELKQQAMRDIKNLG